jgi:hypothetical protein
LGQIEQFPPPGLRDRFPLGYETFAGMGGKEEHAPITAIHCLRISASLDPKPTFTRIGGGLPP